jgi:hypothetical protein
MSSSGSLSRGSFAAGQAGTEKRLIDTKERIAAASTANQAPPVAPEPHWAWAIDAATD